jgi:hypothetical protein
MVTRLLVAKSHGGELSSMQLNLVVALCDFQFRPQLAMLTLVYARPGVHGRFDAMAEVFVNPATTHLWVYQGCCRQFNLCKGIDTHNYGAAVLRRRLAQHVYVGESCLSPHRPSRTKSAYFLVSFALTRALGSEKSKITSQMRLIDFPLVETAISSSF